ncbi:hypothetical protein Tco_1398599, partial [Tanacetum coccineum]
MKETMAWRCHACDGFVERLLVCSEDEFEEEDDMEVDIKEDENEPELTYPYEEVDPLNPPPPASELEPKDAIEFENVTPPFLHIAAEANLGYYFK